MAKETVCFPKMIISSKRFWSESQESWISSETKDKLANLKEDRFEKKIQQKTNLICRNCYVYRVLKLALEISYVLDFKTLRPQKIIIYQILFDTIIPLI